MGSVEFESDSGSSTGTSEKSYFDAIHRYGEPFRSIFIVKGPGRQRGSAKSACEVQGRPSAQQACMDAWRLPTHTALR